MVIEAYTSTKPAVPYRGLTSAILLLSVSVGLAAGLTWRRGDGWTNDRIAPAEWDISFRLPRGFVPSSQSRNGMVLRYQQSTDGATAELSFWKMESGNGMSEARIAERILRDGEGFFSGIFGPPPQRSIERMGNRRAIELRDPALPMIVRAVTLTNGRTYAVALRLTGWEQDAELYQRFDRACRSIEFSTE